MKPQARVLAPLLLLASTAVLAQNSAEPKHAANTVTGTVTYRQRIALPPDAVVHLAIVDISSLVNVPVKAIAEEQVPANGRQVPIAFDVRYDPAALDPTHRYQIRATITSGDKVLFTSTTAYPVLTHGAPEKHIDILVQQAPPESPDSKPATPLTGTHWTLTQLNGEAIKPQTGHGEVWIELNAESKRLAGSGGCNRLMGSYELDGSSLRFRQVASTMMACPGDDAMPREQSFIKALDATATFHIRGSTLTLRGSDSTLLARLTAQAPPKAPTP